MSQEFLEKANYDWEGLGFLAGLSTIDKIVVSKYYDEVTNHLFAVGEDFYDDEGIMTTVALPAIRRIYLRGVKSIDPKHLCTSLSIYIKDNLEYNKDKADPLAETLAEFCDTYRQ